MSRTDAALAGAMLGGSSATDNRANPASVIAADETAVLASGGRISFGGFLLRLAARLPFLFIAGRLYGAASVGRFAYAIMIVELTAMLATLGLRRGLAEELARAKRPDTHVVADALLLAWAGAALGAAVLIALPAIVFPSTAVSGFDRWFPLIGLAIVASEVTLAALAFRHDIAAQVRARSVIEPWTLTLMAAALGFTALKSDGLLIAYVVSMLAAMLASLIPFARSFGWPHGWQPHLPRMAAMARSNIPLAGADAADWGSRRLDIFILGRFASAEVIGIYFVAQNIASLPAKLRNSFDPILAPLLTTNLARGDRATAAGHIAQVAFWVVAAQLGTVLALGVPARAAMGLFGPAFASGALILVLLLTVELLATQAAISEAALIYVRRNANLAWSVAGIAVQVGVTLLFVERFGGVAAAGGLAVSALFLSVGKSRMLRRELDAPVTGWRWSLVLAALPAFAIGLLVQRLPEWAQLGIGMWVVLAAYCAAVWLWSFRGADRELFKQRRETD